MVKTSVNNDAGGQRKREKVSHGVGSREVKGGVGKICRFVEAVIWGEDTCNVVDVTKAIEGAVGRYREVRELPGLEESFSYGEVENAFRRDLH